MYEFTYAASAERIAQFAVAFPDKKINQDFVGEYVNMPLLIDLINNNEYLLYGKFPLKFYIDKYHLIIAGKFDLFKDLDPRIPHPELEIYNPFKKENSND